MKTRFDVAKGEKGTIEPTNRCRSTTRPSDASPDVLPDRARGRPSSADHRSRRGRNPSSYNIAADNTVAAAAADTPARADRPPAPNPSSGARRRADRPVKPAAPTTHEYFELQIYF